MHMSQPSTTPIVGHEGAFGLFITGKPEQTVPYCAWAQEWHQWQWHSHITTIHKTDRHTLYQVRLFDGQFKISVAQTNSCPQQVQRPHNRSKGKRKETAHLQFIDCCHQSSLPSPSECALAKQDNSLVSAGRLIYCISSSYRQRPFRHRAPTSMACSCASQRHARDLMQ